MNLRLLLLLLLPAVFALADDADPATMGYLALGSHEVTVIEELLLHDDARDKNIPLRIYHPADGGPYPVILFSHGAGDSNETAPHLMKHWASHGYVVILPTHFVDIRPEIDRSLKRMVQDLQRPNEQGPTAWDFRIDDLKAIIDALPTLDAKAPELAGKIDPERVGAAGHSFGAYTVMLLGGATLHDPVTGEVYEFADPRPRAFVMISGPGSNEAALNKEDSWKHMDRPLMVFAGSRDPSKWIPPGPMPRADAYAYSPPGDKYLVYLEGANHISYVGPLFDRPMHDPAERGPFREGLRATNRTLARLSPRIDQTGLFEYTKIATTAFWDTYLKNDPNAKAYLESNNLQTYSHNIATLKTR